MVRSTGQGKKVTLPKGRTFYAKYKRVRMISRPSNVKIKRIYRERVGE